MNNKFEFRGFEGLPRFDQSLDEYYNLTHPNSGSGFAGPYDGDTSSSPVTLAKDLAG